MAENIQKIKTRYPFGGFYLELLPEAERKELESMPEEVLLPESKITTGLPDTMLPIKPSGVVQALRDEEAIARPVQRAVVEEDCTDDDDIGAYVRSLIQKNDRRDEGGKHREWVADVIDDDYKHWFRCRVVIDAGTGRGKTSFIVDTLLKWIEDQCPGRIQGCKILYLCNRISLKNDVTRKLKRSRAIEKENYDERGDLKFKAIDVHSYQWLEKLIIEAPDVLERLMKQYGYVVADECHYFFSDAAFNHNTDLSYRYLKELSSKKVIIYMSATANLMFDSWRRTGIFPEENSYYLPQEYDHITQCTLYYNDKELVEIVGQMPPDEKMVIFVKSRRDMERYRKFFGDEAAYFCSSNNAGGAMDPIEKCVNDCVLQKRILVTTVALYNGIDIEDPALKHIVIELWDPTDIRQAIGRKRPINKKDTCQLYFRSLPKQYITTTREKTEYWLEPGQARIKFEAGRESIWQEFLKKPTADDQIKEEVTLTYSPTTGSYTADKMAIALLRDKDQKLRKMEKLGYEKFIEEELWSSMGLTAKKVRFKKLEDYLENVQGQMMLKEELRAQIMEAGQIAPPTGRCKNRPLGQIVLNREIRQYGYEIQDRTDWGRNSATRGKTFWVVTKLQ